MALERKTVIDLRQVLEDGQIQVREATYIVDTETGKRVSEPAYYRYVVAPGDDLTKLSPKIRCLAAAEWTPDVVNAYNKNRQAVLKSVSPVAVPTPTIVANG